MKTTGPAPGLAPPDDASAPPHLLSDDDLVPESQREFLRVTAALKSFDFRKLKQSLVMNRGYTEPRARHLIRELSRFLVLKVLEQDWDASKLSPSFRIDQAWHSLLEFPLDYIKLCNKIIPASAAEGKIIVIDHNPLGARDPDQPARHQRTLDRYKEVFGIEAPVDFWDKAMGHQIVI